MDIVTNATAYFVSSERDNEIFIFFLLNFFSIILFVCPDKVIYGLPDFLLRIIISLKLIPFDIPVPKALEKASLAANLLE